MRQLGPEGAGALNESTFNTKPVAEAWLRLAQAMAVVDRDSRRIEERAARTWCMNLGMEDRILLEAKRSRRISPFSKHQHNSLKSVPPQLNFQPDFQVFLRTFKNPKTDFSSIDSVTSMIKTVVQSLFPGKIVSTLL